MQRMLNKDLPRFMLRLSGEYAKIVQAKERLCWQWGLSEDKQTRRSLKDPKYIFLLNYVSDSVI